MIARKVVLSFISNIFNSVLSYIALFFIARHMGPEVVGSISYAVAFIGLLNIINDMGFGTAHIKRISEGRDLGICNGTFLTIKIILNFIMVCALVGYIFLSKYLFNHNFQISEQETVILITLISTIISNFSMAIIISFGALREVAKGTIPLIIGRLVQTILQIFISITSLSVIYLALSYVLGAIIVLIGLVILFYRYPIKKPSFEYFKSYTIFAIPIMFISGLGILLANFDKIMIYNFFDATEVGYFAVPQQISIIILTLSSAIVALMFPMISELHEKGDIEQIKYLSKITEKYLSILCLPIVIFILVLSEPIISIMLGSKFLPASFLFRILFLTAFINALTDPYTVTLSGMNRIKLVAKISAIVVFLNIILNIILIPKEFFGVKFLGLGAEGAAISTLLATLTGGILYRLYVLRIIEGRLNQSIFIHVIAGITMGSFLYIINSILILNTWYDLIIYYVISFILFILILYVFKEINKNDFYFFLDTINLNKMKNYIKQELK